MIPNNIYEIILKYMPRPCVDLVIRKDDKILLLQRLNNPDKGNWGIVGGMIEKGETILEAVKRKAIEEINIDINVDDLILFGAFTYFREERQDVCFTFLIDIDYDVNIVLDNQHNKYSWFSVFELPQNIPTDVRNTIEQSLEVRCKS